MAKRSDRIKVEIVGRTAPKWNNLSEMHFVFLLISDIFLLSDNTRTAESDKKIAKKDK